jgi:RNA 3'-terminal phosphate cyclase
LKTVEAAREVGKATVEGARLGSQSLVLEPTGLCSGDFASSLDTFI